MIILSSVNETDVVYLEHPGLALQARIYRNESESTQSAIIDIHSGAWTFQDRTAGAQYDRYLASAGFTVIAIDHRQGPDYKHPSAIEDIEAAIEYTRVNAETWGADPEQIGLIGSSSGGHLALLAGITTSQEIEYVLACWPVSNPAYRYAYAQRENRTVLVEAHEGYFGSVENMQAASVHRTLDDGEWTQLPPTLIIQSGDDRNVPLEMTSDLLRAFQSAGGYVEYAFFPGEEHCFGHSPSPATDQFNALIVDFARRHTGK